MNSRFPTRRAFIEKSAIAVTGVGLAFGILNCGNELQPSIIPVKLGSGEKLRIGIIGCGARSVSHINAVNYYGDKMEIAALCDLVSEKMEEKKKLVKSGDPAMYTDYQEMLRRDDIHAVANITSNTFHREGTVASLQAGKHVLCEKPLALTVTECKEMISAADRYRKVLQVGTQSRHNPGYQELAKQIHEGLIGRVLYAWIHSFRNDWLKLNPDPEKDSQTNWRMKQDASGGIIFEMGIHMLDYFNWFINSSPEEITCIGGINNQRLEKRDSWDHIGLVVKYANNVILTCGGNLYSCGGPGPNCLFGDAATLAVKTHGASLGKTLATRYTATYWRPYGMKKDPLRDSKDLILPEAGISPSTLQYEHFLEAVLGKKQPFPSGSDHLPAIQIARGSLLAMAERRHVSISEVN